MLEPFSQHYTGIESGSSCSVSSSKVNVFTRGLECSTLGLTICCWGSCYSYSNWTNSVVLVKGIVGC
jgi:hypothetical protein